MEIKFTKDEYNQMSKIASKIYNRLPLKGEKMTLHQMFILGFLHGRQFTLEDMGILEGEGDGDEKIYKFLEEQTK